MKKLLLLVVECLPWIPQTVKEEEQKETTFSKNRNFFYEKINLLRIQKDATKTAKLRHGNEHFHKPTRSGEKLEALSLSINRTKNEEEEAPQDEDDDASR
jgi:hypothetical protein